MRKNQTLRWIINPAGDGLVFIREMRGNGETWPVVLSDVPAGLARGFGDFPHELSIVEYLVECRNSHEGIGEPSPSVLAAAALVEAAGCSCHGETLFRLIADAPAPPPQTDSSKALAEWLRQQQGHGKRCPVALAAQIRGQ